MILLLTAMAMMASDARCATADFCPTDADLIAATHRREQAHMAELLKQFPDSKVSVPPILGISDVFCSAPLDDGERTHCKFTLRYPETISYRIAALAKKDGVWTIESELGANRAVT